MDQGNYTIAVSVREATGKQVAKQLRQQGQVPGVVYGSGKEPVKIQAAALALNPVVDASHILQLAIDGGDARNVLVKEVQRHCIRGELLHVDFMEVRMDVKIRVTVSIEAVGEAAGEHHGGILEHQAHDIEIECLPMYLPEKIECDVSALEVGDSITAMQLVLPEGVELGDVDPSTTIFAVNLPAVEEEPAEAAAAEGNEPEVINKGKEEEDEA